MKNIALIVVLIIGLVACQQNTGKEETSKETVKKAEQDTIKVQENPAKIRIPSQTGNAQTGQSDGKASAMQTYNAGVKLYADGDLEGAMEQFRTALDLSPQNSEINHYIGRIYYDKGQKELALSYYEDAVRYNIYDSVSILGIGQIYFDLGDTENAMKYYNMSIDVAPNFALAYYNRGTLLGMQKMLNSSLQDLDKAIELDPTNGHAYVNRGLAYYYAKEMEKACENWQIAADMGMPKGIEAVKIYCK